MSILTPDASRVKSSTEDSNSFALNMRTGEITRGGFVASMYARYPWLAAYDHSQPATPAQEDPMAEQKPTDKPDAAEAHDKLLAAVEELLDVCDDLRMSRFPVSLQLAVMDLRDVIAENNAAFEQAAS